MKVSILIPCYNEKDTIREIIERVRSANVPDKEIIVIDDGSVDGTRQILQQEITPLVDKIIYHERNQGKGAAIRSGIPAATGDIIIIQDADLEYDPKDYPALIGPVVRDTADVVFSSRFAEQGPQVPAKNLHRAANKFLTFLSNMFTGLNLSDMASGYKMFRREILQAIEIEEDGFGFDPEITAKISGMGCRIREVAVSYHPRTYREGKKIGWRDGLQAVYCILRYNLFRKTR